MTTIKKITKKQILRAVEELNKGKLISFPTETVYGLGAVATNDVAIAKIFKCKNRPKFNPIIAHFSTIKEIENHCEVSKEVK
ncbi:MAG: L-threonylcarbamoyladenylate synthase, partial [Alphaproteobacteria bacterium]